MLWETQILPLNSTVKSNTHLLLPPYLLLQHTRHITYSLLYDEGSLFYLTNIVCHFLQLYHHTCRQAVTWAVLIWQAIQQKWHTVPVRHRENILHTIKQRKANWIHYIWHRNCLLNHVIEGTIEGMIELMEIRGKRRKQLPADLRKTRGYCKLKEEAADCNLFWKMQWICQTTDYKMNEENKDHTKYAYKKKNTFIYTCIFNEWAVAIKEISQ